MHGYHHILVGTDFSSSCEGAFDAAALLATRLGARMTIMHVHLPGTTMPDVFPGTVGDLEEQVVAAEREELERCKRRLPIQVAAELRNVTHGSPAAAIAAEAQESDVDLCVVGRHGSTALERLLIGSVAEKVVRHAPCDVLVLHANTPWQTTFSKRIVVATDFSEASMPALDAGAWLGELTGAEVHLLHAFDDSVASPAPGGGFEEAHETQSRLWRSLSAVRAERLPQNPRVLTEVIRARHIADGICNYASEHAAELIVVGAHGRTGLARLLIGSVAERVVRHASCSVLCARSR